jgi:transposase
MTFGFPPGMSACSLIVDKPYRYLKEYREKEPAELALHPEHRRVLSDEL